jgi:hypothetical protein
MRAQTAASGPVSLTCRSCGGQVELPFWEPQARCPHCNTLGYPDRALRNLLPLGWDCPTCGATNDGRVNFCLSCGAGLASRCQRCEAPVYGSICLQCGEHQARPRQLQKSQSERIDWLPVQRERIEKQVAHLRKLEATEAAAAAEPVIPARSPHEQTKAERKAERKARRRGGWRGPWWLIPMSVIFLLTQFSSGRGFSGMSGSGMRNWFSGSSSQSTGTAGSTSRLNEPTSPDMGSGDMAKQAGAETPTQLSAPDFSSGLGGVWAGMQSWWAGFVPSLGRVATLTPEDPEYAYLFAVVLVGLATLPFGLYLIDRAIKHFFP